MCCQPAKKNKYLEKKPPFCFVESLHPLSKKPSIARLWHHWRLAHTTPAVFAAGAHTCCNRYAEQEPQDAAPAAHDRTAV